MIVLDTNVLSEVLRPSPADGVLRWLTGQAPAAVFTTTITMAEVLYGVEALPVGRRRTQLQTAVEGVFEEFAGQVLPFDEDAAHAYAGIVASRTARGRPISQFDAMIAAIARSHRAAVATRNTADFEYCGVSLINPWTAVAPR